MKARDSAKAGGVGCKEVRQFMDRHSEFRVSSAGVVSGIGDERKLRVHTKPDFGLGRDPAVQKVPLGE